MYKVLTHDDPVIDLGHGGSFMATEAGGVGNNDRIVSVTVIITWEIFLGPDSNQIKV